MKSNQSPAVRLGALSLAMLLPSLGTSIANVALPTIARSFDIPFREAQWVVIVYLLFVTAFVVTAGRLGDLFGRKRILLAGIATFTLASLGSAVAPGIWSLVAARAIQGMGAAIMMSITIASVGDAVPKDRIGTAMGLLGTVSAVGTALGPSLGGVLIAMFGWASVFVVLAAAGVATLLACWTFLAPDAPAGEGAFALDLPGNLMLVFALGCYALASTLDASVSARLNAMLATAAVAGLLAFIAIEKRARVPLVRLDLLSNGVLSAGLVGMALISAIVMATLVVGPFYLSDGLGLTPVQTGLVMSIGPGVAALTGMPAGRLVDRFGAPFVIRTSLVLVLAGSIAMTLLPLTFGVSGYVCSLALITAGYAIFQAANNTAMMREAEQDRRGVTSALIALARNVGLISGASGMGAIFAAGSAGVAAFGLVAGHRSGLQLTFGTASVMTLATLAIYRFSAPLARDAP